MKNATLLAVSCLFTALVAPAPSHGEDYLLYAPKPASGDQLPASPEQGVLVRRVTIKRGDTLSGLSRQHTGVASWFPQALLFNTISNPDLIYTGDSLLIPVRPGQRKSVKKPAKAKAKAKAKASSRPAASRPSLRQKSAAPSAPVAGPVKAETRPALAEEQQLYQQAKRAYLVADYTKSLELFGAFLRRYPQSPLAADASLYQADSLLRLSQE